MNVELCLALIEAKFSKSVKAEGGLCAQSEKKGLEEVVILARKDDCKTDESVICEFEQCEREILQKTRK